MDLSTHLIDRVEAYMRERMELFFSRMEKMVSGTWQGMKNGRGSMKLDSDGTIVTGRVKNGAKSVTKGEKCWWDGKMIHVVPKIERKKEKNRKRKPNTPSGKVSESRASDEPITEPPVVIMAQRASSWNSTFSNPDQMYWLSTPSGEIRLDAGWHDETWAPAWEEFKAGNFWLTTYPAPKEYSGFHYEARIQHNGNVASTWEDNTFIVPYIHRYQIDPEKILEVEFAFTLGQDTGATQTGGTTWGGWSSPVRYFYREDRIQGFDIMNPTHTSNGFCGSARNNNKAILLETTAPEKVLFGVGDLVTIWPERACMANNTSPCFGSGQGWAPTEYIAYADPFGGAAAIAGTTLTITKAPRKIGYDEYPYQSYENWTVIEGTPNPSLSNGNQFGFGAQYGRLRVALTDPAFGPNPTIEQLAGYWNTLDYRTCNAVPQGGDWVVKDLSGNEPPEPPLPWGFTQDTLKTGGEWWYTSSRDGIFYAYDVQMVWEWLPGVTWKQHWGSRAANIAQYNGRLGVGSETLCRYWTDEDETPGGTTPDPAPIYRPPLVITRMRVDTSTGDIDHDTYYWVATPDCPDGVDGERLGCYGWWDPGFEDVMLEHAWPDDPRVLDGLDFNTAWDYHYDPIRGWLWDIDYKDLGSYQGKWKCEYWKHPDGVVPGTQAFYDWVDDAPGSEPDGEYEFSGSTSAETKRQLGYVTDEYNRTTDGLQYTLVPVLKKNVNPAGP